MSARVLVVDDVLPNLKLLERKLTDEYFDVIPAHSGQEAIDIATREQPDLILLDVMMPEMDGFEACRLLKDDPRTAHIPIVMVTALDHPSDRVKGLEAGADDFLVKPVKDVELYARVRSLVRLKTIMDELRNRATTDLSLGLAVDAELTQSRPASVVLCAPPGNALEGAIRRLDVVGQLTTMDLAESLATAERLRTLACDVVIIDLADAPSEGLRLVSRIRSFQETRFLPILTVVDGADLGPVVKGFELGVSDCVKLPVEPLELRTRLRTLLRRKRLAERLRESVHMAMQLAATDCVTGLYNRHYMTSHMATLVRRARQTQRPLSVAILDIDHFKSVNDRYGHAAGDQVLRQFAQRTILNIRGVDLAARFGGEEFVVLMPETGLETARLIADRLRHVVECEPFQLTGDENFALSLTVSIGVAELAPGDMDGESILARADAALYRAKRTGRNRVEIGRPQEAAA